MSGWVYDFNTAYMYCCCCIGCIKVHILNLENIGFIHILEGISDRVG